MKLVFFVVLSFLAVIGISYVVFEIYYFFTKIKDDNQVVLIVPKITKNVDVEFSIRSTVAKLRKLKDMKSTCIVCLSDSLGEQTKRELYLLQKDFENLYVLSKEELKERLDYSL